MLQFQVIIDNQECREWLSDNDGATVDDFILAKVKSVYLQYSRFQDQVQAYIDKKLTWDTVESRANMQPAQVR